ncbi:MAG: GAF domain-containing protein [Colwellia sp.]|nr:GAF domain-containing protein [Colwellia sp.]
MSLAFVSEKSQVTSLVKTPTAQLVSTTTTPAITPAITPTRTATPSLTASTQEVGLPQLRTFSPKEYSAHATNWAIVQDLRGVIYVGNGDGVLEFDGVRWRLIRVANNTVVRSLAVDAQGRVYVGAVGEIGYLQPDINGQMSYISLLDKVPLEARNFADVWDTFIAPNGVIFSSFQRLMRLQGEKFESWVPVTAFHLAFQVKNRLFIRELGRGLLELIGGGLELVKGGGRFANERIYAMLATDSTATDSITTPTINVVSDSILVGTRTQGFFKFDDKGFTAWPTEIDTEIKLHLLYSASRLPNGHIALGTVQGGLYIIDDQGKKVTHLNKANGLPDDGVLALSSDREGGLWLGTGNGLARVEVDSPLSQFNEVSGLAGTVSALHRHLGQLYVSTYQGLFRLQAMPEPYFERIDGINSQTWALLSVGKQLLVGNQLGIYLVSGNNATLIKSSNHAISLHASKTQSGPIFVGESNGLATIRWEKGSWLDEGAVPGIEGEVLTLIKDQDDTLWLGTRNNGVIRVTFSSSESNTQVPINIERFGVKQGLPSQNNNQVYTNDGTPYFATEAGVYRFIETTQRFEPNPNFTGLFSQSRAVSSLTKAEQGIWLHASDPSGAFKETGFAMRQADGSYKWDGLPLSVLSGMKTEVIYHDFDDVVWLGTSEGLFRFDPAITKNYSRPFAALVRRVSSRDNRLVFAGGGNAPKVSLDYTNNALRFEFAATSFDGLDALRFQTSIDGNDWSNWSAETYKDYNNLFEGDYRFQVRAKNLYGTISEQAEYVFTLLPPWYRTIWAYLAYVITLSIIGWGGIQWRLQRSRIRQRILETTVTERTAALTQRTEELEKSNKTITALSQISSDISSTFELDSLLNKVYGYIKELMDVDIFLIGQYSPKKQRIIFKLAIENNERLSKFFISMDEKERPAVWCIEHKKPLIINDFDKDHATYFGNAPMLEPKVGQQASSLMYWPLIIGEKIIGVLTVQSYQKNAYNDSQQKAIQTLASTTAIALDNANAYREVALQKGAVEEMNKEILASQRFIQTSKMAALGTMTAGVAHEINNPTNFAYAAVYMMKDEISEIKAFLKQMAGGDSADPQVIDAFNDKFGKLIELVKTATEGTNRIKMIVEDLRVFARLDDAKKATAKITDLLTSTVHLIQTQYDGIEIIMQFDFSPELSCFPSKLNQVFMNIIVNACQAITSKQKNNKDFEGEVLITTTEQNGRLMMRFKDNGCGMDKVTLQRIFEPFYTTKDVGTGTGLGMAITFGIIEEHGGSISVDSTLGEGSEMMILL